MIPSNHKCATNEDLLANINKYLNLPDSAWKKEDGGALARRLGAFLSKNRQRIVSQFYEENVVQTLNTLKARVNLLPQRDKHSPFSKENLQEKISYFTRQIAQRKPDNGLAVADNALLPEWKITNSKLFNSDWYAESEKWKSRQNRAKEESLALYIKTKSFYN
jgi:hypothetical protein